MIYKIAEFTAKKDKVGEVIEIVREFIMLVKQNEPEILRYESLQEQDGARFFHIMCFKDRKAESAHQQALHTLSFVKKLRSLCEKEPLFTTVSLIDGT